MTAPAEGALWPRYESELRSRFDAEGKGHHGKAGVAHFYDTAIAPNKDVTFEIHKSHLCGAMQISHLFIDNPISIEK